VQNPTSSESAGQSTATETAPAAVESPATPTAVLVTPSATAGPKATPEVSRLTLNQLRNGSYTSLDWGEFQLTDGVFYRTPPTAQESRDAYTTRMLDPVFYGDINGDGVEDAVVFLVTQSGGTGNFVEMAAVLNLNGQPENVATLSLGDRVVVEAGSVLDGVIHLQMRVHGPNDGMCCPSQAEEWSFHLINGVLVRLP